MTERSSGEGDGEHSGDLSEVWQGVKRLGSGSKKVIGSVYALLFDRPLWQRGILSVVLFVVSQFVGDFVKNHIISFLNSLPPLGNLTPDGPLLSTDQLILLGIVVLLLYTMYKLNRIENGVEAMSGVRTDGGRPQRRTRSDDSRGPDGSNSGGSGEGAVVGMLGGAIAGSPGGPAGALAGAVAGAFLGDALEKQSERATRPPSPPGGRETDEREDRPR